MTDDPVLESVVVVTQDGDVNFALEGPSSEEEFPDTFNYANASLAAASMLRKVARDIEDGSVGMMAL